MRLLAPSPAAQRANARATRHPLSSMKLFVRYRKSKVPEGGWTNENFVGEAKLKLRQDMLYVHRSAVLRMMRKLPKELEKLMTDQIERILLKIERAYTSLYGVPLKAQVNFDVPSHAPMWAAAIEEEFASAGHPVAVIMAPAIQSVAQDVHEKVCILLGSKPTKQQMQALNVRTRSLAKKVTGISGTTRNRLQEVVADALRNNMTVFETIEAVRDKIPAIVDNRIATIVRTEMGRASDEAIKNAMVWGGTVTHFDVIGCQRVEPPRVANLFGVPTCNITGVPIQYESTIEFHINHTGCIVAAMFVKQNGEIPEDPGLGNGQEEPGPE